MPMGFSISRCWFYKCNTPKKSKDYELAGFVFFTFYKFGHCLHHTIFSNEFVLILFEVKIPFGVSCGSPKELPAAEHLTYSSRLLKLKANETS